MTTLQRLEKAIDGRAKEMASYDFAIIKYELDSIQKKHGLPIEVIEEIMKHDSPGQLFLEAIKQKVIDEILTNIKKEKR